MLIYNMSKIFFYISSYYLKIIETKDNKRIYEQEHISEFSMEIYKKYFFNKLESKLYNSLNEILIREERDGNIKHRSKIITIMKTITSLDYIKPEIVKSSAKNYFWIEKEAKQISNKIPYQNNWYKNYFEPETIKYVKNKSERDIKNNSASEYVKRELKYIHEEHERLSVYINPEFHNYINDINYSYLISDKMNEIAEMDSGISFMFQTQKKDELSELFQLFTFYPPSLELIQKRFRVYINKKIRPLSNDKELAKKPIRLIPSLINLKKEIDEIVDFCFENNADFQNLKEKELSFVMGKELPKQLADYSDFCMRIGFKGASEEEIDKILNDIIYLFKNIKSKLKFKLEYEKKMSERLIKDSSLSIDIEKLFISKLKKENDIIYVSKMNEMINDLEKSKVEMQEYNTAGNTEAPNGIKFKVQIISRSAWDINEFNIDKIEVPQFLNNCIIDFQTYYLNKHKEKQLIWHLNLSQLEVQYLYLRNKNISISTLIQFLALLYLETEGKLTLEQIAQRLGCNIQLVINDIIGLIFNPSFNPKGKIDKGVILANIDTQTKEFKADTEISINKNFVVTHQKFNTMPLTKKKSETETKTSEIEEALIIKRYEDYIIQSNLLRIFKSRIGQEITNQWLVRETSKQIDLFKVEPIQIRENIEKLIEKGIINRKGFKYEYIA